jgi:hypothetical protein
MVCDRSHIIRIGAEDIIDESIYRLDMPDNRARDAIVVDGGSSLKTLLPGRLVSSGPDLLSGGFIALGCETYSPSRGVSSPAMRLAAYWDAEESEEHNLPVAVRLCVRGRGGGLPMCLGSNVPVMVVL